MQNAQANHSERAPRADAARAGDELADGALEAVALRPLAFRLVDERLAHPAADPLARHRLRDGERRGRERDQFLVRDRVLGPALARARDQRGCERHPHRIDCRIVDRASLTVHAEGRTRHGIRVTGYVRWTWSTGPLRDGSLDWPGPRTGRQTSAPTWSRPRSGSNPTSRPIRASIRTAVRRPPSWWIVRAGPTPT